MKESTILIILIILKILIVLIILIILIIGTQQAFLSSATDSPSEHETSARSKRC